MPDADTRVYAALSKLPQLQQLTLELEVNNTTAETQCVKGLAQRKSFPSIKTLVVCGKDWIPSPGLSALHHAALSEGDPLAGRRTDTTVNLYGTKACGKVPTRWSYGLVQCIALMCTQTAVRAWPAPLPGSNGARSHPLSALLLRLCGSAASQRVRAYLRPESRPEGTHPPLRCLPPLVRRIIGYL